MVSLFTIPPLLAGMREGRRARCEPALADEHVLRPRAVFDPFGVSEVRVPLEKGDSCGLVGVRAGVADYVEPVPDVDDVDQTVPDDREAPDDDLVRAARECGVFIRHCRKRRG